MRVLLTVHQFLPKYAFGTERLTYDLGRELLRRGHEVSVLTTDHASPSLPHDTTWDYEYGGLRVRVIGVRLPETPNPLRYEYDNPRMAEHLRAYMEETRPDLVHVVHAGRLSGSVIPTAKSFGAPTVFTATDFWSLCRVIHLRRADTGELCEGPNRMGTNCMRCYIARAGGPQATRDRLLARPEWQLGALSAASRAPVIRNTRHMWRTRAVVERTGSLRRAVNAADVVLAPTRLNRELLISNGISPSRIRLSPYGIDTSDVLTAPRSPVHPETLRVGYIGSLARHKGADVLVRAFREVPKTLMKAELKIYGDPSRDPAYFRELRELAGNDPRVSFLGTFEGERIGWVLSEIDVLVVPSAWYENTPLVVYFAFASGTPVVATNLGGLSEAIVNGKNGLLFEMGDARDLNGQLLRFFLEPDLLATLRDGISPVRTARESVDELEELYGDLLDRKKPAKPGPA